MQKKTLEDFELNSYLSGGNADYLETIYDAYLADSNSVSAEWRQYFQSLPKVGNNSSKDVSHEAVRESLRESAKLPKLMQGSSIEVSSEQERVDNLIDAYRNYGHISANLDPLGLIRSDEPRLSLQAHGLSQQDFNKSFLTRGVLAKSEATLDEILSALRKIYCGTVAYEYMYIESEAEQAWLKEAIENTLSNLKFDADKRKNILSRLIAAEGLEKYLDVKYVGQKRFSLEGGESMIPMLDEINQRAGANHLKEVIIGMAHRGRLNVLLNIMGKSSKELFDEFEGKKDYGMTSGDVKYHLGFSSDIQTQGGALHLSLAFNPSHLEFISPLVMGSVRARQDRANAKGNYALAVMIHGDSAFTGQGVVMETLNMSQTRAYDVGGSIHLIFNNQVGFTTSHPKDTRSARYCSSPAKMIDAPIIHVNGDDPEACLKAMILAFDYRQQFNKDVVIDLVCYRRLGHNEADEPSATQPLMYQNIRARKTSKQLYAELLIKEGVVSQAEVDAMENAYVAALDKGEQVVKLLPSGISEFNAKNWAPYLNQGPRYSIDTGVPLKELQALAKRMENIPTQFELQRQVAQIVAAREKMWSGQMPLDWGAAETLAYATILNSGSTIRFTGQDSRRGTFFHRHAALIDQKTGEVYMPLAHLGKQQGKLEIYDSVLSETAVLAFEYGYANAEPNALVIWEAQFGDFANGAQVIIDQFISSAWQKWKRLAGIVMMLPHGYEGAGPEHSSARLERYLQLAAEDNMQICVPSTPAQIFHLLRRQVVRPVRIPLIIMTPKSLLRHKLAVSAMEELTTGHYQLLIKEIDHEIEPKKVRKVVVCSGKVYYDLLAKRRENKQTDVAIIRIEQLYPFPYEELKAVFESYPKAKQVVWCQEEPMNQGAWFTGRHRLVKCMSPDQELIYAGREPMASTAAGYPALHNKQQIALVDQALA